MAWVWPHQPRLWRARARGRACSPRAHAAHRARESQSPTAPRQMKRRALSVSIRDVACRGGMRGSPIGGQMPYQRGGCPVGRRTPYRRRDGLPTGGRPAGGGGVGVLWAWRLPANTGCHHTCRVPTASACHARRSYDPCSPPSRRPCAVWTQSKHCALWLVRRVQARG